MPIFSVMEPVSQEPIEAARTGPSAASVLGRILIAIVVLGAVGVVAFAIGRNQTTSSLGGTGTTPITSEAPTSGSGSNDLQISVGSNSAPGIAATSCELGGNAVIAIGSFTHDISRDTNPSFSNPYSLRVDVFDGQNADIGNNVINFGSGQVDSGQWQVTVNLQPGFTAAQCVAGLTVDEGLGPN